MGLSGWLHRFRLLTNICRNPFDVTGARLAGLGAFWVDRASKGWTDQLPMERKGLGPMKIVHSLGDIIAIVNGSS